MKTHTKIPMTNKTLIFLQSAPAMWNAIATGNDQLTTANWQAIERELDGIAQQAAMLSAYLGQRLGLDGSGMHPHPYAVKRANRRLVKVRRALGVHLAGVGAIPLLKP